MAVQSTLLSLICAAALLSTGCVYDSHAQRGAMIGGLTGTALGAAIGEANDEPLAGAAIGALAGTLTGAAIGDGVDADLRRADAYQAAAQQQRANAVTSAQLVEMSRSGLSEPVIMTHLQTHGVAFNPTVNDLMVLKQQGVSDGVLQEVQRLAVQPRSVPVPVRASPVIVEEHYYGPPGYYRWGPRHHHHDYCAPPRGGTTVGFSYHLR